MRNLYCLLLLCCFLSNLKSQSKFELDIFGLSVLASPFDGGAFGLGTFLEPRYNLNKNLSFALKGEIGVYGSDDSDSFIGLKTFSSLAFFGDYYLAPENKANLFFGLGFGGCSDDDQDFYFSERGLALFPRFGVEITRFRILLEYTNSLSSGKRRDFYSLKFTYTLWSDRIKREN